MSYALRSHVLATETEDGYVLLDEKAGTYFRLNRSGSRILSRLLNGETPDEVIASMQGAHPERADRIPVDVRDLIGALQARMLVVPR